MIMGVIGTAGRGGLHKLFSANRMDRMVEKVKQLALDNKVTGLISGGAAFSDHLAVVAASELELPLTLALPTTYDMGTGSYVDTGVRDFKTNPGGTANYYHRLMAEVTGGKYNIQQIKYVYQRGLATLEVYDGFFARNSVVATRADILVAFTFSEHPDVPADGGTLDTWNKAKGIRIHFKLDKVYK